MTTMLERSMRTILTGTGLSYDDLCMHPNSNLPEGLTVPRFELFNGTGNPKEHLRAYCDQLVGVRDNQALIMRLFSRSLTGEASEWFMAQDTMQDILRWVTWEDMVAAFMERFCFNMKTVSNRYYLDKVKQKSTKNFCEYASRWRTEAARVQPPMGEEELVSVFIRSQEIDFYEGMLSMAGRPFSELVKMGEAIEDGLKTGRIISITGKSTGSSSIGFMHKKKEDVDSISYTPSPKPKRREGFPMEAYASPPPNTYIRTPYNTVPVYYAQQTFQSPPPNYQAPQPNYKTPPPTYRTPQNNQPNTYQNQPPPNSYNVPRSNFEKKLPQVFTPLIESRANLFKRLSAAGMIQALPLKVVDPKNLFYQADHTCAYHSNGIGHSTEDCIYLKYKIHDLIERKEIVLETALPNVNTNPLLNHGNNVIHMIEREEDRVAERPTTHNFVVKEFEYTVASLSLLECPQFKVLDEAHVPAGASSENLAEMVAHDMKEYQITFTEKELPKEGTNHNKALHITIMCRNKVVT
ncbi:uncharacterized protein LOC132612177 [Lycium barbarum]|uniref:uncharacterized protein LOC132612177 n=1 Tax=Lycium barbarum TaxID=112863 RepID=UPI00293EFBB6|nr:uncharacterized protein LOC132612177 [Lycium barbarum]